VFTIWLGGNIRTKSCPKDFRANLGKFGQKTFRTTQNLPAPTRTLMRLISTYCCHYYSTIRRVRKEIKHEIMKNQNIVLLGIRRHETNNYYVEIYTLIYTKRIFVSLAMQSCSKSIPCIISLLRGGSRI